MVARLEYMIGHQLGAKLGASIKEKYRAKYYESFANLLRKSNFIGEPLEQCFIESLPATIYNNVFSTPKSYVVILTNGVYLDLKPSTRDDFSRIAVLNNRTINHLELVSPSIWDKIGILSSCEYVQINFTNQSGNNTAMHLFSDQPGQSTLTMDDYETSRIYRFLKEVKETSRIKK